MKNLFDLMMKEWERTLLGAMLLMSFIGIGLGTMSYLGYLGDNEQPSPPKVSVTEAFNEDALAFLNENQSPRLGNNHAMRLQVPRDWIDNMEFKAFLAKRDKDNKAREAERLRQIAQEEQRKRLREKKKKEQDEKDKDDKKTDPKKPTTYQLVFKGFMRAPSGEMLAYMATEAMQGDERVGMAFTFIQPGSELGGFTVQAVDDEFVTLTNSAGEKVNVLRGQRLPIDNQNNAPAPKKKERPPAPKRTPTPGKPASSKEITPQMINQYNDYLKKTGKKADKKSIRQFMKKQGFSDADVKRILGGKK